ncbi:lipopolysaccharide heptosyltransferase RfaC [Utexia brackfieldae]|uniref:lipopolysaccharide heptosyltransferase RfaC n=1 Tax=Utexia brackfieldae TaxID=3074108 RepID=UPI00370DD8F3
MVKRVLIVKTSSMGDVLHTLPALTDAQQIMPDIAFDWVVEENFAQIPTWHDAVSTVIPVAIRRWRKHWFGHDIRLERKQFYATLREKQYDGIIDAQGLIKSAFLITRKARGVKHGLDRQSAREPIASWWYDIKHHVDKKQHAVERIRQLFAMSLAYQYHGQGDYGIARHFLTRLPATEPAYLVFLHATTRDNKHWSESQWRDLIAKLAPTGLRIKLPWGAAHEQQRAVRLATGFAHVDVLPKLSLAEVAAVLAGAQAVVSVDTGLSHLAAALARPNITLYGPTNPGLIGGYGQRQFVIKSADEQVSSISAQLVFERLLTEKLI